MEVPFVRVGALKDDTVRVRSTALAPGDQADHLKQKHPLSVRIKAMLASLVDILLLFRGADDYFMALS
jgi:hypothetical protein